MNRQSILVLAAVLLFIVNPSAWGGLAPQGHIVAWGSNNDGQPVANHPTSIQVGQNDMPLAIGGRLGAHNSFHGLIDEVRIFSVALTQSEVTSIFND